MTETGREAVLSAARRCYDLIVSQHLAALVSPLPSPGSSSFFSGFNYWNQLQDSWRLQFDEQLTRLEDAAEIATGSTGNPPPKAKDFIQNGMDLANTVKSLLQCRFGCIEWIGERMKMGERALLLERQIEQEKLEIRIPTPRPALAAPTANPTVLTARGPQRSEHPHPSRRTW